MLDIYGCSQSTGQGNVVAFAPFKNSMIKHEHDTFKIECMGYNPFLPLYFFMAMSSKLETFAYTFMSFFFCSSPIFSCVRYCDLPPQMSSLMDECSTALHILIPI
jgi:hypothetical protein